MYYKKTIDRLKDLKEDSRFEMFFDDEIVINNRELVFGSEFRDKLVNIVNREITYNNKKEYVPNVISLYVQNVLDNLNNDENNIEILNYEF